MTRSDADPGQPSRPTVTLAVAGAVLLLLAILISPERLAALGPLRASLESGVPSVRDVAVFEVWLFRIGALLGAFLCVAGLLGWQQILRSKLIEAISAHPVHATLAESDGQSSSGKTSLFIYPSIVVAILYIALAPKFLTLEQLAMINQEEGVIESGTAILFFLCSIGSLIIGYAYLQKRATSFVVIHGLLALGFFLFAGEEISWGQRIFQIETLDYFAEHNVQGENNLHNLVGYMADHIFILGVCVYGFIMPAIQHRYIFARKLFDLMGLPLPSLGLAGGFLVLSMFHNWTIYRIFAENPGLRIAEMRELLSAIAFSLLLLESWAMAKAFRPRS